MFFAMPEICMEICQCSDAAIPEVTWVAVPKNSVLGRLKYSDTLFEIYAESYGRNPIVIQGVGAGTGVTARGIFGTILRLSERTN
jgi:aspartokinase/homoserine dehydrogenase 1